jgi:hypothetical protein
MTKQMLLNLTFWNKTYATDMMYKKKTQEKEIFHVFKIKGSIPKNTLSWDAVIKNTTNVLNISSLVKYQQKQKLNHSIFWKKDENSLNVSVDLLPNTPLSLNCSGNFIEGINITANLNDSLMWKIFASKEQLISSMTLRNLNRTVKMESRTCQKSKSLFLNISTWDFVNKTAFNGSISWYSNATTRKTSLNVTLVDTSLYFTAFSLNNSHFNLSLVRRNKSELYKESSLEFRPEGQLYKEFNITSLKRLWKNLNLKTYHIPAKLLNITVKSTSDGVNLKKTGQHLKVLLENLTRELSAWKFTQKNITRNLFNLTKHLLNVTSHSLPNITANYNLYVKNDKFNIIKFWKSLTMTIADITKEEIATQEITKELIQSLKRISASFNKTRVIGNLSEIFGNISLYRPIVECDPYFTCVYKSTESVIAKILIKDMSITIRNFTKNVTDFLKKAATTIGNWNIHDKTIDNHLKELIPKVQNQVLYLLNETVKVLPTIHKTLLILRHDVAFFVEYLINTNYPNVHNNSKTLFRNIKEYANSTSFAGGILDPSWSNISEMLNISIFNTTLHTLHKYLICGTHLETIAPFLHQPDDINEVFHKSTMNKTLEKILNRFLNKALEMYNMTLRLPSWHMNKTHDNLVYFKDLIVMMLNDTVNVMDSTSNKHLTEIVTLHLNQTWDMTSNMWNMTKYMMEGILNVSIPVNERWETMKENVTELYLNTSEV